MVTTQELEELLKSHHWTISRAARGSQQAFAAKRRQGKSTITRYIGTENKLKDMTEADVLAKLNRLLITEQPS